VKYLSVCSGIEAATVAWNPLGWEPFAFAEIEAFPSAVLKHRYGSNMPGEKLSLTGVPNLGDINGYKNWPDARIDLLVGGTPCQSFSVAGLRKGLEDPRGNLALTFVGIADRYKPEVVVWENVPGVLSQDGGRAFGSILGALAELGYHIAYRILDAQYVRVDGLGRAVPQRRRRVFVVGYSGNQQHTAEILFERESLQGDTPPCREARKNVVQSLASRARGDGGLGTDFDLAGGVVPAVSMCLNAGSMGRRDAESGAPIPVTSRATGGFFDGDLGVAHALRAEGFDASEDGTGRGTPLVPVAFDTTQITSADNRSNPRPGDPCHPLAAGAHAASHANAGIPPAVTVALRGHRRTCQAAGRPRRCSGAPA